MFAPVPTLGAHLGQATSDDIRSSDESESVSRSMAGGCKRNEASFGRVGFDEERSGLECEGCCFAPSSVQRPRPFQKMATKRSAGAKEGSKRLEQPGVGKLGSCIIRNLCGAVNG